MEITICPGKAPRRAAVPLSKSEGHRALILAAMAQGETLLPRLPASGDLLATMDCLRQMGTSFTERENSLLVTPIAGPPAAPLRLDCRESGSTLRFLLPVAAALGLRAIFTGRGRLPQRPVEALLAALQRNGITAEVRQHPWEIELAGRLTPGAFFLPGNVSSQYVSGLMLALPLLTGPSEIRLTGALESAGYAGMTEEMLRRFGLELEKIPMGWRIPGGMKYQSPGRLALGGDWSHAAFWLAAGCLAGPVTVTGLEPESTQPDRVILPLLRQMGARIELSPEGITAYPHRLTGTTIDVSGGDGLCQRGKPPDRCGPPAAQGKRSSGRDVRAAAGAGGPGRRGTGWAADRRERTVGRRGRSLRRPPAGDGRGGGSPGLPGAGNYKRCRMCGEILSRMVGAFL